MRLQQEEREIRVERRRPSEPRPVRRLSEQYDARRPSRNVRQPQAARRPSQDVRRERTQPLPPVSPRVPQSARPQPAGQAAPPSQAGARRPSSGRHTSRRRKRRSRGLFRPFGFFASGVLLVILCFMLGSILLKEDESLPTAVSVPSSAAAEPSSGPPYTVVIDPGHGGIDLGTDSGYVTEVEMIEATTDALVELLTNDPNFTPLRTRENGEGMSVAGRADVANDNNAALFLSIHGNYDETLTASGFECYAQTPGRATHEDSLRFANEIVAAMSAAGAEIRGLSGVRYAYYVDNGDGTYNKIIAEASDTSVRSEVTFGVLEKNETPAVLVEQCFLSDQADCNAWASAEGCRAAALAYYHAICAYFGTEPVTG